ncbi:hypothetical protein Droror1_Dr00023250 [Drosera rotundifolia]
MSPSAGPLIASSVCLFNAQDLHQVFQPWIRCIKGPCIEANSECTDIQQGSGYRCSCLPGYKGNPYLTPGCTDINECLRPDLYPCNGTTCTNTIDSYICTCPRGSSFKGRKCIKDPYSTTKIALGEKAIRSLATPEGRSLPTWFLSSIDNSTLLDIIDPQVLKEGSIEGLVSVANLAKQCLHLDGKRRPTMREVAQRLAAIKSHDEPPKSFQPKGEESKNIPTMVVISGSSYDDFSTTSTDYPELGTHPLLGNMTR